MKEGDWAELNSKVIKDIIKEGEFGRKPTLGCICQVELNAVTQPTLNSEYLKDISLEVTIGNGDWLLDRLLESCIETMFLEEESNFRIPSNPDSLDSFGFEVVIHLKSCITKPYIFEWTDEDKVQLSDLYKTQGVQLFKDSRIEQAFFKFSKALKILLTVNALLTEEEREEETEKVYVIPLITALYNNLASCQLHYKNYSYVVDLCNKSLKVLPTVKGYYRRGLAYIELKEYEKAEEDLISVLKLEPKNKVALAKIHLIRSLDKDNREKYAATVKRMFS